MSWPKSAHSSGNPALRRPSIHRSHKSIARGLLRGFWYMAFLRSRNRQTRVRQRTILLDHVACLALAAAQCKRSGKGSVGKRCIRILKEVSLDSLGVNSRGDAFT
jgi:hypothetical protein